MKEKKTKEVQDECVVERLKKKWLKNPAIKKAYEERSAELQIAALLVQARLKAQLTQAELAERMKVTQSHVTRMESGKKLPSLTSVVRYCRATQEKMVIEIDSSTL